MWIAIAVVCGLASLSGYALFQDSSPETVGFVLAFAAGAIFTMLADTMMPGVTGAGKLVRWSRRAGLCDRVLHPRSRLRRQLRRPDVRRT